MPISCCDSLTYFTIASLLAFFLLFLGVLLPDLPAFGLKFSLCLLGDFDFCVFFRFGVETLDSSLPIMPFTSLSTVFMEVPALLVPFCYFWATELCVLLRILDILDIELPPLLIGESRASLSSSFIGTTIFCDTSLPRPDFSFQVVLFFRIFFTSALLLLSCIGNSISLVYLNLLLLYKPPVNSS